MVSGENENRRSSGTFNVESINRLITWEYMCLELPACVRTKGETRKNTTLHRRIVNVEAV